MAPQTINILLTTFPGLGLPRTLNLQVPSTSTVGDVERLVTNRLPQNASNLNLTTTSNKLLSSHRKESVTNLLDSEEDSFLPLRLSAGLCGGKGGFGSQLRAAGGRMSSRKKRNQGEQNGSSRTLDGRRVRTVTEAKALAEYLAIKPEMDKKEREEKRKRWEDIVQSTDARKAEILNGSKGKLDGEWVEAKEEAADKAREAILAALKAGEIKDVFGQRESDESADASEDSEGSKSEEGETQPPKAQPSKQAAPKKFFGWDDEDLSDSEEEAEEQDEIIPATTRPKVTTRSKAKAKAKA